MQAGDLQPGEEWWLYTGVMCVLPQEFVIRRSASETTDFTEESLLRSATDFMVSKHPVSVDGRSR